MNGTSEGAVMTCNDMESKSVAAVSMISPAVGELLLG